MPLLHIVSVADVLNYPIPHNAQLRNHVVVPWEDEYNYVFDDMDNAIALFKLWISAMPQKRERMSTSMFLAPTDNSPRAFQAAAIAHSILNTEERMDRRDMGPLVFVTKADVYTLAEIMDYVLHRSWPELQLAQERARLLIEVARTVLR